MSSITKLGKRIHTLLRDDPNNQGEYVDGEWIPPTKTVISFFANIQPAWSFTQTQLLPEGERDKRSIWISSNDWLYEARHGTVPLEADIIQYNGAQWEVKAVMPYGNFGQHCEAIAVKLDTSQRPRIDGEVGVID